VLLLYFLAGLTSVSYGAVELLYPLNLDRLGHPLPLIGASVALRGVGSLLSRFPGGAWYRLSRARLLSAGALALMGVSTVGLALDAPWVVQATLGLVHGLACGLATTFLLALTIETSPRDEHAAPAMAWYTASLSTGYAAGASLGAQSAEWFGYPFAFLIAGLLGLTAAGLALVLVSPPAEIPGARGQQPPADSTARALLRLPSSVWLATLLAFSINVVNDTVGAFFPIYAVGIGISLATVGYLKSVTFLATTGIRFGAAVVFRFLDVGVVNHLSIMTMMAGMAALSLVTADLALFVIFVALGISRGLLRVTSMTAIAEERQRPTANVGMASAVYNAGFDVAAILAAPIAGALAGEFGIPTALQIIALVLPGLYYLVWVAHLLCQERRGSGSSTPERP
jgi:MFS family permease